MLYAAIDINEHAFQAAVFDPESGEVVEERFSADRESLELWADEWRGRVVAVAIEATTWRWVWRELSARGFDVRLAEPVQARALLGRRRSAKTDRLDARWLAPCWRRRCCRSGGSRRRRSSGCATGRACARRWPRTSVAWGQRLHAFLLHEGWPCAKGAAAHAGGDALVGSAQAPGARASPGRLAVGSDRGARDAAGHDPRRAAPLKACLRASPRWRGRWPLRCIRDDKRGSVSPHRW
jgi:hypothetical protein